MRAGVRLAVLDLNSQNSREKPPAATPPAPLGSEAAGFAPSRCVAARRRRARQFSDGAAGEAPQTSAEDATFLCAPLLPQPASTWRPTFGLFSDTQTGVMRGMPTPGVASPRVHRLRKQSSSQIAGHSALRAQAPYLSIVPSCYPQYNTLPITFLLH